MINGYLEWNPTENELSDFYSNKINISRFSLFENEYFVINVDGKNVDKFRFINSKLERIKPKYFSGVNHEVIKPKNLQQELAIDMIQDESIVIKTLSGIAGGGKDFLLANYALKLLQEGKFQKIVYIRNNIEVKDTVPLGALPGSIEEKMLWTAMPLADKVGGVERLKDLLYAERIEISPLNYIRGRDLKDSIIYVTEAENLTIDQVNLLMTRVSTNSQLWINGDSAQIDKGVFKEKPGFNKMIESLSGQKEFGHIKFNKTERGRIAELAELLYK